MNTKQYLPQVTLSKQDKVRARLQHLLDKNSYFLELSAYAGIGLYPETKDSGIITGIGIIENKPCMILANNPEAKAGCYFPITITKTIRALEIAYQQNLPCLHLVDSGGAFIPRQAELFAQEQGFGRIFYQQAQLSSKGLLQYAAILGSCTAGGAYIPIMADACVMIKDHSSLFLAGPPLVAAATGEKISANELGGSTVHCQQSGIVAYEVTDEISAIKWLRNTVTRIPYQEQLRQIRPNADDVDLADFIDADPRFLPDMKGIIRNLVDNAIFDEYNATFGTSIKTGWSKIHNKDIAIIANDGILTANAMHKAKNFINENQRLQIPLLFLHNTHGMQVGAKAEQSGIAGHGANLIKAVACCKVQKYTIMLGNSYGAGNYAMAGRAFQPDFLFQWPNNKIAVMGAKQQQQVLKTIGKTAEINESQHTSLYNSARMLDDGIILPKNTRHILGFILNLTKQQI